METRSQAKQCSAVLALVLESRRKGRSSDCERKEREERERAEAGVRRRRKERRRG